MSMKLNAGGVDQCKSKFRSSFSKAFTDQSQESMISAVEQYAEELCSAMLAEHQDMSLEQRTDRAVLAQRGIRQLTAAEESYYSSLIVAMGASDGSVKSALTELDKVMPETVLDQVMEDIQSSFSLLDAIDFVNSTYMTTWLYNKQGVQTAAWGDVGTKIKGELSGAFGKLSATQCRLTAFMAVSKDFLNLGPAWLDRYMRAILTEAAGLSMECAICDGSGVDDEDKPTASTPVGMTRDLSNGTTGEDGHTKYARKQATAVTKLDAATYGAIIAKLTKTSTGRTRSVRDLIMVVNPNDYYTKVMPATTLMTADGRYVNDVLPIKTKIIQSEGCPENYAAVGLAKQYVGLLGASKVDANSKTGVVTYDDSVQFLDGNRVYLMRLYANGRPKDNTSFELLDISNLQPLTYPVASADAAAAVATEPFEESEGA